MIFVTVGTHEQPFDRLVSKMDELKRDGIIQEEVLIQTGFSTYKPEYCSWSRFIPYADMVKHVEEARIVITHGGPASFIMPIQRNKVPVVVPRMQQFGEHVNDHQVLFCREVSARNGNIILVEDISRLQDVLTQYDALAASFSAETVSNNAAFNEGVKKIVNELFVQNRS